MPTFNIKHKISTYSKVKLETWIIKRVSWTTIIENVTSGYGYKGKKKHFYKNARCLAKIAKFRFL